MAQNDRALHLVSRIVDAQKKVERLKDSFEGAKNVSFKDIDQLAAISGWQDVGYKARTMALAAEESSKLFFVCFEGENSYIGPHRHVDCFELVEVVQGSVADLQTGKTYQAGESFEVLPGQLHHICAHHKSMSMITVRMASPSISTRLKSFFKALKNIFFFKPWRGMSGR
jgi:hypothetical protein